MQTDVKVAEPPQGSSSKFLVVAGGAILELKAGLLPSDLMFVFVHVSL